MLLQVSVASRFSACWFVWQPCPQWRHMQTRGLQHSHRSATHWMCPLCQTLAKYLQCFISCSMSPWHRSDYSLNFTWVKRICWKKQKICEEQKFFSTVVCARGQVTQLLCLNACTYKTGRITPASLTHSTNIDRSSRKCQALRLCSESWVNKTEKKGQKALMELTL